MGRGPGYGVGFGEAVKFHLVIRGAEFYLPVGGNRIQQCVREFLPGRQGSKVFGVVPLAPASDESCLDDHYDVGIFLDEGFDLGNVPEDLLRGGIPGFVFFVHSVRVAETEDALDSAFAQRREFGAYRCEIVVGDVAVYIVREIEFQQEKGTGLQPGGFHAGLCNSLAVGGIDSDSAVEAPFRVGENLVGSGIDQSVRLYFIDGVRWYDNGRFFAGAKGQEREERCEERDIADSFHVFIF